MRVSTSISIDAPAEKVWSSIIDIEGSADRVNAIQSVEILEKPVSGLVGLKWKETRKMFGKEASETMWITDVEDGVSYTTRAESHGSIYISGFKVEPMGNRSELTVFFEGHAVSMGAKIMNGLMGWMIKGSTKKAFQADLKDIKAAVEAS